MGVTPSEKSVFVAGVVVVVAFVVVIVVVLFALALAAFHNTHVNLLQSLCERSLVGLAGVVGNGYSLGGDINYHILHTLLKRNNIQSLLGTRYCLCCSVLEIV